MTEKLKPGVGDNQDLITKVIHKELGNDFDITIGTKGLQTIDVEGYPRLKTEVFINAEYTDNIPFANTVNYNYDLDIIPNLKINCDIVAKTESGKHITAKRINNSISKLEGEKEIITISDLELPDKMVEFEYTPVLLLRSEENVSMEDVYTDWTQFDLSGGGANWQYNSITDEIFNLNNQGAVSGYYNPQDINLVNYNINVQMFTDNSDDDMMGFAFRFQDENNFYSFQWDNGDMNGGLFSPNGARIFKKVNGTVTELTSSTDTWNRNTWEDIKIEVKNSNFKVYRSGTLILEAKDTDLDNGAFGPISRSQPGTYFKNLSVTEIDYEVTEATQTAAIGNDGPKDITTQTYAEILEDQYNAFISTHGQNFTKNGYYCRTNKPDQVSFNSSMDGGEVITASAKDGVVWDKVLITYNDVSPGADHINLNWKNSTTDTTTDSKDVLVANTDYKATKNYTGIVEKPLSTYDSLPKITEEFPELPSLVVDTVCHDTNFYKYYCKLNNNNVNTDIEFHFYDKWKPNSKIETVECIENDFDPDTAQNIIITSLKEDTVQEITWNTNTEYFITEVNGFVVYPEVRKKDYVVEIKDNGFNNYTQEIQIGKNSFFLDFPVDMFDTLTKTDKPFDINNIKINIGISNITEKVNDSNINTSNANAEFNSGYSQLLINQLPNNIKVSSDYKIKINDRKIGWVSNKTINNNDIEKDTVVVGLDVWEYRIPISDMPNLFNYPPNLVDGSDKLFVVTSSNVKSKVIKDNGYYIIYVLKNNISGSLDWNPIIHSGYMYIKGDNNEQL